MKEKEEEKYLGDVISIDGKNMKNIKARNAKGNGIVRKMITILDGIPFGQHYFEVGIRLRNSLLVSSMLFNAEAWYDLSSSELDLLETIDVSLLKQLLRAPRGTPKEMFYLELGCIPFREIVREKRLRFLHYILNEEPMSLVHRVFKSQMENRTKKDWVTTGLLDLQWLGISNLRMDEIRNIKKSV